MLTFSLDSQKRFEKVNANFLKAMGYSESALLGRHVDELVPAYVKKLDCYRNLQAAIGRVSCISDLYRLVRNDGGKTWLRGSWQTIGRADARLLRIDFMATDVTQNVEEAKENAGLINALLRSTAVIEFNLKGEVLAANDRFLQAMSYSLHQIKGKHHSMFCEHQEMSSPGYKEFWVKLNRGELVADALSVWMLKSG